MGLERSFTLKQMRDLIDELYISKLRHDAKCAEALLPRETMEQHLYTSFNTKYGLKTLILEYANASLDGIRRYSMEDNDVAVFGCILRNEVDEEFRFVQKQLKQTVFELLRVYIKGKQPLKSDAAVAELLIKRSHGFILEEEWSDIVRYMYAQEDAAVLIVRVREVALVARAARAAGAEARPAYMPRRSAYPAPPPKPPSHKLSYLSFVKVLLDFQLSGHQQFLGPFLRLFRDIDPEAKGVIDELGFRRLVLQLDPSKEEEDVLGMLATVDPHNHAQMTYSDCVATLSAELVAALGRVEPA